jgi:hypothetical protein
VSSLRDADPIDSEPGDKSPGYYRLSLRDEVNTYNFQRLVSDAGWPGKFLSYYPFGLFFAFTGCQQWLFGVGSTSSVLYKLLSKKGGNCLMISDNIYLSIQVVMVNLHRSCNP